MTRPVATPDRFERDIECDSCDSKPTRLRAWADLNGLDRMEVESIAELSMDDIRTLAHYGEGGIDGECETCAPAATATAQHLGELGGCATSMLEVPRRPPSSSPEALLIPGRQHRRA